MVVNEKINKPTHCVDMVTYNHEKWVRTALDSIFNNSVLPDKVIICDDCSIDETWNIILEFKTRYPEIIDCYRNEKNLGIFQNINQVYSLGLKSGCDIISNLSGDDYLKKGLFEEFNKVVATNKIDVKNDKFIIVTNSEELYPDGTVKIIDNYHLKNEKDLTYYRLAKGFDYRDVGISRNILKNIKPFRYDLGVCADRIFRMDYEYNCNDFYFTPFISSVYRRDVGICMKQGADAFLKSEFEVNKIILTHYKLSKKAKKYVKHRIWLYEYNVAKLKYYNKQAMFPFLLYLKCFGIKKLIKLFVPYGIVQLYKKLVDQ